MHAGNIALSFGSRTTDGDDGDKSDLLLLPHSDQDPSREGGMTIKLTTSGSLYLAGVELCSEKVALTLRVHCNRKIGSCYM